MNQAVAIDKQCSKCKQIKPCHEFNKSSKYKSGLCSHCRDCAKLYYQDNKATVLARCKQYRDNHKEQKSAKDKQYRELHQAELKAYFQKHYQDNKEDKVAYYKEWRQSERGKTVRKVHNQNRKALARKINGSHNTDEILSLFEKQKHQCVYCKTKLIKSGSNKYHIDHILPLSKGGSNDIVNIQLLCPTCNLQKHNTLPEDFARQFNMMI